MTNSNNIAAFEPPSRQKLLKATGLAALVALAIFFTIVLPAELGKDPLHTGAALGLMNLSKSANAAGPAAPVTIDATPGTPVIQIGAAGEAPVIKGTFVTQPNGYKIDSRLKLGVGEGMEIKYHMRKGAGMVYSWTSSDSVLYEFHGESDVKPVGASDDYFESYEKDDAIGKNQSHGTFTSPSTGIQGWFWDNETGGPVTIKLITAGFYDYILQNKDDVKTRLQPTEPR